MICFTKFTISLKIFIIQRIWRSNEKLALLKQSMLASSHTPACSLHSRVSATSPQTNSTTPITPASSKRDHFPVSQDLPSTQPIFEDLPPGLLDYQSPRVRLTQKSSSQVLPPGLLDLQPPPLGHTQTLETEAKTLPGTSAPAEITSVSSPTVCTSTF